MAKKPTPKLIYTTPQGPGWVNCLKAAADAKVLKPSQLKEAEARYNNLRQDYINKGFAPVAAALKAADDATEHYRIFNREMKRRKLNAMRSNIEAWNDMKKWKGANKEAAWLGLLDMDDRAPYNSYSEYKRTYTARLWVSMDGLLEKYKPRWGGLVRPVTGERDLVKAIFGDKNVAADIRALADAWLGTHKLAVKMYRTIGGSIRELESWNLPQHQDYMKLASVGKKSWVDDHMLWLDWDKTRRSDASPLVTDADKRKFLEKAYDTLMTDGANQVPLGQSPKMRAFTNKLENHRVMFFKDADSWLTMHGKYGTGRIIDVMLNHVDTMAHELAAIHRFGPSPDMWMANVATMIRKLAPNPAKAQDEIRKLDATMSIIMRETGLTRTNAAGNFLAGTRNLLTAALLGAAPLIAIPSDLVMTQFAKKFNRLDGMKVVSRYLSMMNPLNASDRQTALRSGIVAEGYAAEMYGLRRIMGLEASGPSWTRRTADLIMNANLLTPHTLASKKVFSMEMLGLFADNIKTAFDKLPFKAMLERHGITKDDWDKFRSVPIFDPGNAHLLRPMDIYNHLGGTREAQELMVKWNVVVLSETNHAILDASLTTRRRLVGDTDPGTFYGEIARSAAMFKNFPVTFTTQTMGRYMLDRAKNGHSKILWGGTLMLALTAVGALRNQLANITQGNDPEDMTSIRFLSRSLLVGGGLGYFGDFLFADYNRYGDNPIKALAGPIAQLGSDFGTLTVGNLRELIEGKDTNFLSELVKNAQKYNPTSRVWTTRLLADRMIWDQLSKAVDPDAEKKFQKTERRREKDFGISPYWNRGEILPKRGPDLQKALP